MIQVNAVNKGLVIINKKNYFIHNENQQKQDPLGIVKGIVLHWTAGDHDDFYNGYHFNIGEINNLPVIIKTLGWNQKGQHLWGRNTGMIGITLCAMKDWKILPTQKQLDILPILIAEICAWKNLNPEGKISLANKKVVGQDLIDIGGFSNFDVISDHRTFAKKDGYGSERQDIKQYYLPAKEKAIIYFKELKSNKRKFHFLELLKAL